MKDGNLKKCFELMEKISTKALDIQELLDEIPPNEGEKFFPLLILLSAVNCCPLFLKVIHDRESGESSRDIQLEALSQTLITATLQNIFFVFHDAPVEGKRVGMLFLKDLMRRMIRQLKHFERMGPEEIEGLVYPLDLRKQTPPGGGE